MRTFSKARLPLGVLALVTMAGCSTPDQRPVASPELVVLQQTELPPPSIANIAGTDRAGVIGPFDRLTLNVFNMPDMRLEQIQVDAAGNISVPLLGAVNVAGKTPGQVADAIAAGLRGRYVRDPQVTVNLVDMRSQTYSIDGEVREPGNYPVIGRMSLMRAVASAKGASEFALLENVVVFRTVGGQRMAALYDLQSIRRGIYADPDIYPNDVIVVGNNQARRIFHDVLQVLPALASPLVVLLTQ